jgi:hypothetical protein
VLWPKAPTGRGNRENRAAASARRGGMEVKQGDEACRRRLASRAGLDLVVGGDLFDQVNLNQFEHLRRAAVLGFDRCGGRRGIGSVNQFGSLFAGYLKCNFVSHVVLSP